MCLCLIFQIERALFPGSGPCGDNTIHAAALSDDDDQDAPAVCFAEMNRSRFSVAKYCTGIERLVLNYLLRLFRFDVVVGDVIDVAAVPLEWYSNLDIIFCCLTLCILSHSLGKATGT
jgi:hypothetical protein